MKRTTVVLMTSLIAGVAGIAMAQDVPSKVRVWKALNQPLKAVEAAPNTYGTDSVSYYRMGGSEFTPLDIPGADDYSDTFYSIPGSFRRGGKVASAYFIGTPHLPSGARVLTVFVEGCASVSGGLSGDVYACGRYGEACTILAPYTGTTGCGTDTVDVSAAGHVVDNGPNGNLLVIRLATINTDGTDSIAGAVIAYQLQVSPAPVSATFPDVPTGDFAFKYVEALVASGITGGCGGGLYCPDSPVTRRQMAIFIAKALGLHFP